MNLNSTDKVPTITPFNPTNVDSYNKSVPMTVYDSLGNEHNLNMYYVKTGDNTWNVYSMDASTGEVWDPATPKAALTTMTFNTNGVLTGMTNETVAGNRSINVPIAALNGSAASTFTMNMLGSIQQNNGATSIGSNTQNGYKPGELVKYAINDDGTVTGTYSNEQSQLLGQIVMANFANNEGLQSEGDNVWSATQASGVPLLGLAGTGNFGKLTNGALESSNVELSKELVNMIVAQRNYQSNAQTIKTQDSILNTLVNLR